MSKPTKATMLAAREDVISAISRVRTHLPVGRSDTLDADWAQLETFIAIALRVMAKTNMSKLISETKTVELAARLAGRIVYDPE
jgi:hypothetical protein